MLVRRLTWSGLEIEAGDDVIVVDLLGAVPDLSRYAGTPRSDLLAPMTADGSVRAAAITHDHSDHLDVETLRRVLAPGAPVLCPVALAEKIQGSGLVARGVDVWETVEIGALAVQAVPAVDGLGAPQVSWVIAHGSRRVMHAGDTLWHGYWWEIAERCGPIDLAFLPINGVTVDFDDRQPPSGIPAVMTPHQAAAAAAVLGVTQAAPIHYGTFDQAPLYISVPDPAERFLAAAAALGVAAREVQPGQEIALTPSEA